MSENTPEQTDVDPSQVPGVENPDQAPEPVDTAPRPEDGEQDVDQEPEYEEADSDDTDAVEDPAVREAS